MIIRSLLLAAALAVFVPGCGDSKDPGDAPGIEAPEPLVLAASPPWVAGFERHREAPAADRGRVLLDVLACSRCHDVPASPGVADRRGPDLARVADRADADWIQRFITDPEHVKPGTTMPTVLVGMTDEHRRDVAEAITHWLVSLRPDGFKPIAPDHVAAERGRDTYHAVGCVACHAPLDGTGDASLAARSVPLPEMAAKYDHDGLTAFLRRPLDHRPAGRMPDLDLSDREASDIAHYLLRDVRVSGAVRYTARRGPVNTLENLSRTRLERSGVAAGLLTDVAGRRHDFHVRYEFWLDVPAAGEWTFHLTSDDGSRLRVDGEVIATIDKRDRVRHAQGKSTLAARHHEVVVEYFQRGKESVLTLEWEGPGTPREVIPSSRMRSDRVPVPAYRPPRIDPDKVAHGKREFAERGCARCHDAPDVAAAREAGHAAGPSIAGAMRDGCLGSAPPFDYHLSNDQRDAIVAALAPAPAREDTPGAQAHRTMAALDCYACHERDGVGGVEEARDPYFVSTAPDQGTEGRIPPRLDGVGAKLRAPWLTRVLVDGVSVRPEFRTRMPRFGHREMEALSVAFSAADPAYDIEREHDTSEAAKEVGRLLVGDDGGLNCISCHHFARRKSSSMQMVDLAGMTERIHRGWYRSFMVNPVKMNPGTRMPAFAAVPEHFGGDRSRQIDAVWAYLEDGARAVLPKGLSRQMRELIPGGEAITYRGKLRHGGFRGIAVGLPEGVHYSIDAERGRWAAMWRGRFLDAGGHWGSQGMGRAGPLSRDQVIPAGTGPDLAILKRAGDGWPDVKERPAAYRFRGYRIGEKKRPTFHYEVSSVTVHDTALGREAEGASWLQRTLTLQSPSPVTGLWFRAASGQRIEADGDGWKIDGRRHVVVRGGAARVVDGAGGKELRALVTMDSGRATIEVDYRW